MTGRQHATIGMGISLPLGLLVAGQPEAAKWAPGWLGGATVTPFLVTLVVVGGLVGALLPDLDTDRSLLESAPRKGLRQLWRRGWLWLPLVPFLLILSAALWLLNELVMLVSAHRGLTHSVTALMLMLAASWLATVWLAGPSLALGMVVGYASHLTADALTPRGVQLTAPWSRRHWHLLPRAARFGGASWRAGCLASLVLASGIALAVWQVWDALRGGR